MVVDVVPQLTWSSATSVDDPENVIVTGTSPVRTPSGTDRHNDKLDDVPQVDAASAVPTPVTNDIAKTHTPSRVNLAGYRRTLVSLTLASAPP